MKYFYLLITILIVFYNAILKNLKVVCRSPNNIKKIGEFIFSYNKKIKYYIRKTVFNKYKLK